VYLSVRIALLLLTALAGDAGAAGFWKPQAGTTFSIILSASPLIVTTPATAVDLDLFETRASTVSDLKRRGKRAICYMSAGSWENWRPDQGAFPKIIIGKAYAGWAGERWLDIRRIDLLAAPMRARLDRCKAKGFAAVDPDNVDGYQADTGFPLTRADAIRYFRFLAAEAHKRGLAIGLKNAAEFSTAVLPQADFAVTEDCFDQGWCRNSRNFIDAGKPVFAIEYTDNEIDFAAFCRQAKSIGLSPLLKGRGLGIWERRCP
jgi:hypothetical protein